MFSLFLILRKNKKFVSEGKDVISYELITGMESFFLTPENEFWEKTECFSDLKQNAVNENDYENSKYFKNEKLR